MTRAGLSRFEGGRKRNKEVQRRLEIGGEGGVVWMN